MATPTVQPRGVTPGQIRARVADYTKQQRAAEDRARRAQEKADKKAAAEAEKKRRVEARKAKAESAERVTLARIEAKGAPLKTLNSLLTAVENIQRQQVGTQETVGGLAALTSGKASSGSGLTNFLPWIIGVVVVVFLFRKQLF